MEILHAKEIPSWLKYPREYLWLLEQYEGQTFAKFTPWYLLDSKLALLRWEGLRKRYPHRKLFAFAARFDNDDVACWEDYKQGCIIIIHDGASEASANRREFASFWEWFRMAIEDMIAHDN